MDQEIFNAMLKKIITIAAFVAIAAGCAKVAVISAPANIEEETEKIPEVTVEPSSVVFTAGIDTKAYLDGGAVKWSGNESITIWNGIVAAEFTTTDSGASATFSTAGEFTETGTYTALYPHNGSAVFSAGSVATTLPASQVATAGSFDPAANLAVASSTTTDLTFYNLVSYLKFTVPTGMTDLTSVSFSGNKSEKVAGAATVNVSTKALSATGSYTATLTGTFAEGSTYYLAIAPQEFSTGYTVTITRTSGTYTMVSSKDVTFTRSTARNIGNLWDGEPVLIMQGTALDDATTMTKIVHANQPQSVFNYRGSLKAGYLTIREKFNSGEVAKDIVIPENGTYHVVYNKTTGRCRVYSLDVYVHFGTEAPMIGYSESFFMNQMTSYGASASLSLKDYYENTTGMSVSMDASNSFVANNNTGDINSSMKSTRSSYFNDDFFPLYGWARGIMVLGANTNTDTATQTVVISGLDNAALYDVRVSGTRFGTSKVGVRQTEVQIGSTEIEIDGFVNWSNFSGSVAAFDSIAPSSGEISISLYGLATGSASECDLNFIYISKVVYSQN